MYKEPYELQTKKIRWFKKHYACLNIIKQNIKKSKANNIGGRKNENLF